MANQDDIQTLLRELSLAGEQAKAYENVVQGPAGPHSLTAENSVTIRLTQLDKHLQAARRCVKKLLAEEKGS